MRCLRYTNSKNTSYAPTIAPARVAASEKIRGIREDQCGDNKRRGATAGAGGNRLNDVGAREMEQVNIQRAGLLRMSSAIGFGTLYPA